MKPEQKSQMIEEMETRAFFLLESSKTTTGKPATTREAVNNRNTAYLIRDWAQTLRASDDEPSTNPLNPQPRRHNSINLS